MLTVMMLRKRRAEIGRRSRFKICRWKQRAGSIPASGTSKHKRFNASGY